MSVRGRTQLKGMENKFYLHLEGSGLELVDVTDVLDYLGKRTNKKCYWAI